MTTGLDRDKLLAALADLPQERALALATLPQLLSDHGEGHATVTIRHPDGGLSLAASNDPCLQPGMTVPNDGVVARAVRERSVVYVTDARAHPDYRTLMGRSFPVELALPMFERDQVTAVLNVERDHPYNDSERRALEVFVAGVSHQMTLASRALEARLTTALSLKLAELATLEEAVATALGLIAAGVGAGGGALMAERKAGMFPVAIHGIEAASEVLRKGAPYPLGLAWDACRTGEPSFTRAYQSVAGGLDELRPHIPSVVLALPVGQPGAYRAALCLTFPDDAHVSAADIELLEGVCRHLAVTLTPAHTTALQSYLLELHTRALDGDIQELCHQILDAAVQHVPGAEAGSLLVRRNDRDVFRFLAANGFDLADLAGTELSEKQMRAWYASDDRSWFQGRTRILTSRQLDLAAFSRAAGEQDGPSRVGGLDRLKSTACLPVTYRGQVLAVLNLDNYTRDDAFGPDSLRILSQFGPPVATLLASAQHRDEITRASRTDLLTGLANRAGFNHELHGLHARSARSGHPYTLVVMDLSGFKAINDGLGHGAGDSALISVAHALRDGSRAGDSLGRWGGDEFVALLPNCAPHDAQKIASRLARAVAEVSFSGRRLGIDIGTASFPVDGRDPEELLRKADARMYANKRLKKSTLVDAS